MANIFNSFFQKFTPKQSDTDLLIKEVSSSSSRMIGNYDFPAYNPDTLVGKKGIKTYQKMKEDDQVKASLTLKKFARLSTPWTIKPGDKDNELSVELADFVEYSLKNIKGTFEHNLLNILTAIEYGFSVSEKVYGYFEKGKYKGKIGLKKLATREPFNYDFVLDGHDNVLGLTCSVHGENGLGSPENPYPLDKFVIYSYNSEHDNPYGTSDLRAAYRAYWSKDLNIHWWNIFNERFGMPTVMFTYPAAGKDAKGIDRNVISMVDNIIKNLQAKSGFRVPDNIKAELLEATRQGQSTYETAINKYDLMISRAILVPSLLGFSDTQAGGYALGKTHFDIFMFVLEQMGRDIEETIVGEQIIKPLITMNYGEIDEELMPYFSFESLVDKDSEARSRIVQMLVSSNVVDKNEDWVREYIGIPERDLEKYPVKQREDIEEAEEPVLPFKHGSFKLSRKPTKFENKVDFVQLSDDYEMIGNGVKKELAEVVGWWKEELLKKATKILETKDMNAINNLQLRYLSDFKNVLSSNMIKVYLDSKLHSLEEIGREGVNIEIKKKFSAMFAKSNIEPWTPLPPRDAMDFFNKKVLVKIVLKDGTKKLISLAKLKELDYYDKKAFAIAGVEQDYILKEAKMALYNGIKQESARETMTQLEKIFEKYLDSGILKDGKIVDPARLETIVRTNTTEALSEGRMAMFNDPDVSDFVPYVMWSSILDDRTTAYCSSMDGKIFRKSEFTPPPAHYNCRSIPVPITKYEVEKDGVDVSDWREAEARAGGRAEGFKCNHALEIVQGMAERCPRNYCGSSNIKLVKNELGTENLLMP